MSQERSDFASFYEAARDDCLRTVYASVGDLDTAQDMVAEAFVRAWASWRKVSRHPAPRAWVVRTALNASVSSWRKRRRDRPLADDDGIRGANGPAPAPADPVDGALMAMLLRLPARQREVIALRIFLDLDTAGTAKVLGIAPGTVKAHLSRGLTAVREELIQIREQESR
jgi:RNA polymerase sigma-70 factor (sigma-E family)